MQSYWNYKFREININVGYNDTNSTVNTLMHVNGRNYTEISATGDTLGNLDENALTPLQLAWNSYLSIANMIPNLVMLLLNATIGHKIPMRPRLLVSLFGIIILFVVTDVLTQVNTDRFQQGFLSLTLVTVVLITSCVGILQVNINSLK